ncbi:unnamed protein product [Effrenium voratum]|nr:unnamed protein product [Effrenium voratum]
MGPSHGVAKARASPRDHFAGAFAPSIEEAAKRFEWKADDQRKDACEDSGLATPTRLQNSLRMKYAFHLDAARDEGTSAWPDADEEDDALDAETFADDVAQLSHTIEDLSRSLRLEHLQKNRDAKIAAKAEAARREKEAELRRARRKEQMARDPKRKVALRLEQGRHALSKATTPVSGAQEVPLVPFHSDGCGVSNKAPVPIVDVLKIQRSCEGLGHHQSART